MCPETKTNVKQPCEPSLRQKKKKMLEASAVIPNLRLFRREPSEQ